MLTVYCHGMPGSSAELDLFGPDISGKTRHFVRIDRQYPSSPGRDFEPVDFLAEQIRARFHESSLRLVGFSIGGSIALRLAAQLGAQVAEVDLVSAAAPLGLSERASMAGAPIFALARNWPTLFRLVCAVQRIGAQVRPDLPASLTFASVSGEDADLWADGGFRARITHLIASRLATSIATYRIDIASYVQNWSAQLAVIRQPVRIFHGQSDNWSPIGMAQAMRNLLPNCVEFQSFPEASHYSALRRYLAVHAPMGC